MATEMNRQSEGGSGSAENKGEDRQAQKAPLTTLTDDQRNDIAEQTGLKPSDIADVQQTGALSGRDDASGGSGDGMENTSSNEGTDRF
jgi:hypothetical protein